MALSLLAIILICVGSVAATSILLVGTAYTLRRLHFSPPAINPESADQATKIIATPIVTGPLDILPQKPLTPPTTTTTASPIPPPPLGPPPTHRGSTSSTPKIKPPGPAPSPKIYQLNDTVGDGGLTWGDHQSTHSQTPRPPAYSHSPQRSGSGSLRSFHARKASVESYGSMGYPNEKQEMRLAMYERFGGPGQQQQKLQQQLHQNQNYHDQPHQHQQQQVQQQQQKYLPPLQTTTTYIPFPQDPTSSTSLTSPSPNVTPAMSERTRFTGGMFGPHHSYQTPYTSSPTSYDAPSPVYHRPAPPSRYTTAQSHIRQNSWERPGSRGGGVGADTTGRYPTPPSMNTERQRVGSVQSAKEYYDTAGYGNEQAMGRTLNYDIDRERDRDYRTPPPPPRYTTPHASSDDTMRRFDTAVEQDYPSMRRNTGAQREYQDETMYEMEEYSQPRIGQRYHSNTANYVNGDGRQGTGSRADMGYDGGDEDEIDDDDDLYSTPAPQTERGRERGLGYQHEYRHQYEYPIGNAR